jgi:hypothetical protein
MTENHLDPAIMVRIPVDRDHRFRLIAIIQSVRSRSSIPVIPIIPEMTVPAGRH